MNFIFLRHSEYEQPEGVPSALLPHSITAGGEEQARIGAEKLIRFFKNDLSLLPSEIECSVLLRAFQTAQVIASELKREFNVDLKIKQAEDLVERKLGSMANLSVEEIEDVIDGDPRYTNPPENWKAKRHYKLPYLGCENLAEAGKRVSNYIKHYKSQENSEKCFRIIIGHGASFRHAAFELGVLSETQIGELSMFYAEPLFFKYKGNGWDLVEGKWKVRGEFDRTD